MAALWRSNHWLARSIVALEVLFALLAVAWFEPRSMTHESIVATGPAGWVLVLGAAFCCLVALADVLVNDLMPARFELRLTRAYRHAGFMGLAIQLSILGVLVATTFGFSTLLLVYWLNAAFAASVAFFDIFDQHRKGPR